MSDKKPPTMEEYRAMIAGKTCKWDGKPLSSFVDFYDHRDGWRVAGMEGRWWLSVRCTHCGYDWSLNKLGVPRDA